MIKKNFHFALIANINNLSWSTKMTKIKTKNES